MRTNKLAFIIILICTAVFISPVFAEKESGAEKTLNSETTEETDENKFESEEDFESDFHDEFGDEFDDEEKTAVYDPLIGYNRFMTVVNDKLYYWVLKPIARGYRFVIPGVARRSIDRCYKNLLFPIRFANNLFQLKFKRSGTELARFTINSSIGILGLGDPAKAWGNLDPCVEDFGQTLGHYGTGRGFYFVIPLLGPSNLRDGIGRIPDYFLNPFHYIDETAVSIAIDAGEKINYTSLHIGEYESVQKDAIDFYIFMRDAYEQNRQMKIEE